MKRKLALLLATVMAISTIPVMSVSAAVSKSLNPTTGNVPEKTIMLEYGIHSPSSGDVAVSTDDLEYYVSGPNLIINLGGDTVTAGETFKLELTNADFMFRSRFDGSEAPAINAITDSALTASSLYNANGPLGIFNNLPDSSAPTTLVSGTPYIWWNASAAYVDTVDPNNVAPSLNYTYDITKGVFGHSQTPSADTGGIYFRVGDLYPVNGSPGVPPVSETFDYSLNTALEVPYALEVSSIDDSVANITILNPRGYAASTDVPAPISYLTSTQWDNTVRARYSETNWRIVIPIVALTDEDEDVNLRVEPGSAGIGSSYTYRISTPTTGATNTYFDDLATARDSFNSGKLVISESRAHSLDNGSFEISLPKGFEWNSPAQAAIGVESGLSWADGLTAYKSQGDVIPGGSLDYYTIGYKIKSGGSADKTTLSVTLNGLSRSNSQRGNLYITGLTFNADEDAAFGTISAKITNVKGDDFITTQTFTAGTRRDWDINFHTEGTIPELFSGRYDEEDPVDAGDDHQAATVIFEEYVTTAWWSGQATFILTPGAKFRRVEFTKADNLSVGDLTTFDEGTIVFDSALSADPGKGEYLNDNTYHGHVKIDENTMYIKDIQVQSGKRALIKFDSWISIQPDFEGDVKLVASGRGVETASNGTELSIVIAKAVRPVSLETKVTDVKIGYQYQTTADIIIKESKAGALPEDKEVWVSVSDLVSNDMRFSPDTRVAVTEGDIEIGDIKSVAGTDMNSAGQYVVNSSYLGQTGGSTISFNVDDASTAASTITLSNVAVRIDRTVPLTNYTPYKVIVWGPGPGGSYYYQNYHKDLRDKFLTAGVSADYLRVITAAEDIGLAKQEVRVTIGNRYFTVNGTQYDMDAAAYISTASNSTMVPIRFVANALGINDSEVIWDGENKIVTINASGRIVQFTIGSSTMKVNGADVTMVSPDNLPVKAEIVNDRSYVPFRAMGYAFGIEVAWDEATQTAIYNPGVGITTAGTTTEQVTDDQTTEEDTTEE